MCTFGAISLMFFIAFMPSFSVSLPFICVADMELSMPGVCFMAVTDISSRLYTVSLYALWPCAYDVNKTAKTMRMVSALFLIDIKCDISSAKIENSR